jgi:hypothetical protein
MITATRRCKKCGEDFQMMELEHIPSSQKFCHMCWVKIPDHIPWDQKLQFLERSSV